MENPGLRRVLSSQHQLDPVRESVWKGRVYQQWSTCYKPGALSWVRLRNVTTRCFADLFPAASFPWIAKLCAGRSVVLEQEGRCVFAMLTKWFSLTRLETRTKESNLYASIWVVNPDAK